MCSAVKIRKLSACDVLYIPPEIVHEIVRFSEMKERKECRLVTSDWKVATEMLPFVERNSTCPKVAASEGNDRRLLYLLIHGADVHAYNDRALRVASKCGNVNCVKLLLENEANVNAMEGNALRVASMKGHLECIRLLLSNGANVYAKNSKALYWACLYGHTECIKLLLDHGENIHIADRLTKMIRRKSKGGSLEEKF